MANFLGTYDPEKVQIQMNFTDITGFASGSMVTVTRNEDRFNNAVGTKGDVSRAYNRNNTYTIKISLQQTSPSNQLFNRWMNAEEYGGIPPVLSFRILDPASYEQVFSAACWLQTEPERSFSNEVETREWTFFATAVGVTENEVASIGIAGANLGSII